MAFQLSPGVNVSEIDLSTVIPAVATSIGGFAGPFSWGPAEEIVTVSSENVLRERFGLPSNDNNQYEYWFSAANFLSYSNNLKVVRAIPTDCLNATGNTGLLIKNSTDYEENYSDGTVNQTTYGSFAAKYAGEIGNGIQISICPNANSFEQVMGSNTSTAVLVTGTTVNTGGTDLTTSISVGDLISVSNSTVSTLFVEVAAINATTITVATKWSANVATNANITRRWKYFNSFGQKGAPGTSAFAKPKGGQNDEMHIVVVDTEGRREFSGVPGTVVEKFSFLSKASDATLFDGTDNFYKNVLNTRSKYVWWLNTPSIGNNWGNTASNTTFTETSSSKNVYVTLDNGDDGDLATANVARAYDVMENAEVVDVSLIVSGPTNATLAAHLLNIAENRKDCMLFLSPRKEDVVDNYGNELRDILSYRDNLLDGSGLTINSSYAVMDSGWKYQYDKYNNLYRWVPLNGDIAGLTARTDQERDPWFSPAGVNRGILKNVIKLAWNPKKAERDDLYLAGINSVVSLPGEGVMLYGDKTMLDRPSAFDRINVRRLFIVLEKSITKAARSTLFEFNDQFTRAQFVALIEPYLRDVQGRRGITDFRVVCDETNNTPEVVDSNRFVGDIYIKPARSVNFIQLNFIAVRTGVAFSEIVGQF